MQPALEAGQLTAGSRCVQEVVGNKALSRKQILDRLSSPYKWAMSFLRVRNQTALEVLFYPKTNLKPAAAGVFFSQEALSRQLELKFLQSHLGNLFFRSLPITSPIVAAVLRPFTGFWGEFYCSKVKSN